MVFEACTVVAEVRVEVQGLSQSSVGVVGAGKSPYSFLLDVLGRAVWLHEQSRLPLPA